jgi:hypothetical protein
MREDAMLTIMEVLEGVMGGLIVLGIWWYELASSTYFETLTRDVRCPFTCVHSGAHVIARAFLFR